MKEMKDTPTKNKYYSETLDKFLQEYVTGDDDTN